MSLGYLAFCEELELCPNLDIKALAIYNQVTFKVSGEKETQSKVFVL